MMPSRGFNFLQQEVQHNKGAEMEFHSHDLEQITARLLMLEKQNRRFKQLGAAALIIAATVLVTGQAAPPKKTIEAQEFILRDTTGKVRAKLAMSREQTINSGTAEKPIPFIVHSFPTLSLYDDNAVNRLAIDGDGTILGSGFVLLGPKNRPVGEFHADNVYGGC